MRANEAKRKVPRVGWKLMWMDLAKGIVTGWSGLEARGIAILCIGHYRWGKPGVCPADRQQTLRSTKRSRTAVLQG